jgi:hypothetical protein
MASGSTVDDFRQFCRRFRDGDDSEPFTMLQLYAFMLDRGFLCGMAFKPLERIGEFTPDEVRMSLKIEGQPALLKVASEEPQWEHAVYWDGYKVWDPRIDKRDGKPLCEYEISLWVPISTIDECAG